MKQAYILKLFCIIAVLTCILSISAFAHTGDWEFGIDSGSVTVIEPEADEIVPVSLSQFTGSLFNGDWGVEFFNLPTPDLESVRIVFTSVPTGLVLYHEGDIVLGNDGSSTGSGYFDMSWPEPGIHHAHIDAYATAPGTYTVTFKLVNAVANDGLHTTLGDSGEYSVDFKTVPEPSGLLALAVPLAALVIRRRK